ncbi:GerW family sporulation protein [Paenibacillus sp. P96]|uniref:GerW family sporulation protein n=1 Tax=Paenibacillus zeirhizosphaerae TaxID=2987519 RepID=A0ABT9FQ99_9BACL|nr:GerW family sporulation protein [Paenibacillus sp. P96]MDP4096686.1 GerW family sporulation protein [Paenibacillus sp. P96]
MSDHPIQGLMQTAMENIKGMVDVNTIVGDAVETPDGSVILPISKVGFGFAAGGSDFNVMEEVSDHTGTSGRIKDSHPFGGGSGGGVSIQPIAFLVVGRQGVQIVPLDNQTHLFEKIIDSTPHLIDKIQSMIGRSEYSTSSADVGTTASEIPPQAPFSNTNHTTNSYL